MSMPSIPPNLEALQDVCLLQRRYIEELEKESQLLLSSNSACIVDKEKASRTIKDLIDRIDQLTLENGTFTQRVTVFEEEQKTLNSELLRLTEKVNSLAHEREQLRAFAENLQEDHLVSEKKVYELEGRLSLLKQDNAALSTTSEELHLAQMQSSEKIQTLTLQLEQVRLNNQAMHQLIDSSNQENEQLKHLFSDIKTKLALVEEDKQAIELNNQTLKEKIEELVQQKEAILVEQQALELEAQRLRSILDGLSNDNQLLKEQQERLQENCQQLEERINRLVTEKEELERRNQDLQREQHQTSQTLHGLLEQNQQSLARYHHLSDQYDHLKGISETQEIAFQELNRELSQHRAKEMRQQFVHHTDSKSHFQGYLKNGALVLGGLLTLPINGLLAIGGAFYGLTVARHYLQTNELKHYEEDYKKNHPHALADEAFNYAKAKYELKRANLVSRLLTL